MADPWVDAAGHGLEVRVSPDPSRGIRIQRALGRALVEVVIVGLILVGLALAMRGMVIRAGTS